MKQFVTPKEIGDATGQKPFVVRRRAAREHWPFEERRANGGITKFYALNELPDDVSAALAAAAIKGAAANCDAPLIVITSAAPTPVSRAAQLTDEQQQLADARLAILSACDTYVKAARLARKSGETMFCEAFNRGGLVPDESVRALVAKVAPQTLRNWRRSFKREGVFGLAGAKYGKHRKGTGQIDQDGDIRDLILAMIAEHPHASAALVMRAVRARFATTPERIPAYTKLCRWVAAWKKANAQVHLALTNPDAWKSKFRAAGGSASAGITAPNQVWEFDSTPADIMLKDGKRHAIIGVIDVGTRRLKLHVSRTSTSAAIASLQRKAFLDWGVPKAVRIDNGKDYTSRSQKLLYAELEIEVKLCPPFSPERKPHIERGFKTFSHDLLELLPGFTGHNVAEQQAIRARKSFAARRAESSADALTLNMTAEELQQFCDRWCDIYHHRVHQGLGDKTPFQQFAAFTGRLNVIPNERALDVLLMAAPKDGGWRTVLKKGVKADGCLFDAPELGGYEGTRVFVRLDPEDIGRVYVYDAEKNFICIASDPEIAGISRREVASHRRAKQTKVIAAQKAELKELAKGVKEIGMEILVHEETAVASMAAFPKLEDAYETEALGQAAIAAAEASQALPEERRKAINQTVEATPEDDASWERLTGTTAKSVEFVKPRLRILGS